jgi:hypothetical protein
MAVIKRQQLNPAVPPSKKQHNIAHADLVRQAEKWLRRQGCAVTIRDDLRVYTISGEQPDAIAWRDGLSILVECKVSRADFLADAKKPFRAPQSGMGDWRFYLSPPGVVGISDLPEGWGLLWTKDRGVEDRFGVPNNGQWWSERPFVGDKHDETLILASALRRFAKSGQLESIYGR